MNAITLNLPDSVLAKADVAANVLHCSIEEILSQILERSLPSVDDAPENMRTELLEMTWLNDAKLLEISHSEMPDAQQKRLAVLATQQQHKDFSASDRQELENLRQAYGAVTLRKARALALLSLRNGKPFLAQTKASL